MENQPEQLKPEVAKPAEHVVEGGLRQVGPAEKAEGGPYDFLMDPNSTVPEHNTVEGAAVRPEVTANPDPRTETLRQMGIAAADREIRQSQGLPPRTFDLK